MSENAGRFLQPAGGPLSGNVVDLVRPELRFELRSALHRAFETSKPWLSLPIPVRFNGAPHRVLMHVKPADDHGEDRAIVLFIEGGTVEQVTEGQPADSDAGNEIISRLREVAADPGAAADDPGGIGERQRGIACSQRGAAID
jgi:two-component system CheB/CheR fusion protein